MSTIKPWQERVKPEYHTLNIARDFMQAEINELRAALQADAERLDTLESLHQSSLKTDIHIGGLMSACLYQRTGIGSNLHAQGHGKTVRQMIDAMKWKS